MENIIGFLAKQNGSSSEHLVFDAEKAKHNNLIGKKLFEARSRLGFSQSELRKKLQSYGVPTNKDVVGRWERGETIPTCYQFIALCNALQIDNCISYFSGQSKPLLNELGCKKIEEYKNDLLATGLYCAEKTNEDAVYIEMPVSVFSVAAGGGAFLDSDNYEMMSFPKDSVPDRADFGVKVAGDSMEPVFSDGQLVWVEKTTDLKEGDVGVFIYDSKGYIKSFSSREPVGDVRSILTDSDGVVHKQPVLLSLNSQYCPIIVSPLKRFEVVGRVL